MSSQLLRLPRALGVASAPRTLLALRPHAPAARPLPHTSRRDFHASVLSRRPQALRVASTASTPPFPPPQSQRGSSTPSMHRPLTSKPHLVSSVAGPTSTPLEERTLGDFWNAQVKAYPNSPALVSRHEAPDTHSLEYLGGELAGEECLRWSYQQLDREVDSLARGLLKMGVKKGDRVGAYLSNGSPYVLLQWATAKIGVILVCINPASQGPELLSALNLTSCSHLFIPLSYRKHLTIPILKTLLPSLASSGQGELADPACPSLKGVFIVDNTKLGAKGFGAMLEEQEMSGRDFRTIFDREGSGVPGAELSTNDDVINIQFSSGTTGLPKAIALSHRNILNNGILIGRGMKLELPSETFAGERLCNTPPMFHCFGLVLGNLAVYTHAGCIVFASETFDASLSLRAVHQEKCTALHGVPTMFLAQLALLDDLEKGLDVPNLSDLGKLDFSSLRTGIAAGSPVPDETMRRLIARMNLRDLVICYGQTESSPVTTMSITTDPVALRCQTVGRVLPHTHIRIVDPSDPLYPSPHTPSVPIGTPGELWTGGYALQKGYWRNEGETEKSMFFDETGLRWLITGDQGVMDEEGYVSIVGRIKDIIIRGGENLFPVVIENKTLLLPGVADCSVIAVPDPVMGEVAGIFVRRENSPAGHALTSKQVSEHVHRALSHQSSPDWVWWLGETQGLPDSWPTTASGKIRKVELREWAKPLIKGRIGRTRIP